MCFTAASVNGKIYAFKMYTGDVAEYDVMTNSWTMKNPVPNPVSYATVVECNGSIYLIGGYTSGNLNQVYDPLTNTWDLKANMPTARQEYGVAVISGKIYVIGGELLHTGSSQPTNITEVYDPSTDTWSTDAAMPTPRQGFGMVSMGNNIYAIGGYQTVGMQTWVYLTKNEEFMIPEFSFGVFSTVFAVATLSAALLLRRQRALVRS
jgi:N-acetylneuraminic acid mutarotase